ncbi:uncharacterized protein N7458_007802 [Penicillium daleae]|uniref:SnoaL-like domain-containing protein n=1 Tax=Penicillium daleae TaxID=63821 RepID=A0AAD6C3J9_9EURO|nr:uncharacterized protein N7458_007802 [Penicillium daleae]KAJ5443930.1 hypothetical protein N7458_007802 [Penicillium daleae]
MTSPKDVTSIVRENLHLVFGEADPEKRLAELSRLWVPSSKSLFIDPLGLFRGHEAINNLISSLHAQYPGMAFTELGPVQILYQSEDEDLRVARLPWGYGHPGKDTEITGEDVATVVGGKMERLYTFLNE